LATTSRRPEEEVTERRIADFYEFAVAHLPSPPSRLLEIGCGRGELALALAKAGHAVTAIDPEAPEGTIFRQVRLEDFADPEPYDAVLANVSLHHIENLPAAVDRVAGLLHPAGVLVLEEFASERLSGRTGRWYFDQRRALSGDESNLPSDFETWHARWKGDHEIHSYAAVRRELDRCFVEVTSAWVPYLYSYRLDDTLEPLERELIAAGEIEPVGVRFVGTRR
jgi:SAM-dependent methyltransferase